jgi:hypothetical protein
MSCCCNPLIAGSVTPVGPPVGDVDEWWVDAATGIDAPGRGTTAATPFKTAEYLNDTLNPGGAAYEPTNPVTTIHFAAGQYGSLDLKGRFPPSTPQFGAYVQILCEVALGDPIVISNSVTANPGTSTRGQMTTVGPIGFVDKKRYVVLDGVQAGSFNYTMGQNASAQNFFVGAWGNYDTGAQYASLPVGSTVAQHISLVSFQRINMVWLGPGYCEVRYAEVHGTLIMRADAVGGTVDLVACELFGDAGGGAAEYYADCLFAACHFVSGAFNFWRSTAAYIYQSCTVEAAATIRALSSSFISFSRGSQINGGRLVALPYGEINFNNDTEFENGAGAFIAIDVRPRGLVSFTSGRVWGVAGVYATAINLQSLGAASYATAGQFAGPLIPATTQLNMSGHPLAIAASIPRSYDRAGTVFALNPDPAAIATTT